MIATSKDVYRKRLTDGRTMGELPPPADPLIASAFGDTDGEFFVQKTFWPNFFLVNFFFERNIVRQKMFLAKNISG